MADFSNIPTGLKINSQIPLDVKGYALNEATLAYLGVDDNLAFTYHEGIRIVCIQERTLYEWREVQTGEENTGLVPVDYTYPSDLEDVYGINYSDRTFNFFLVAQITPETLEDYVLQIDLPQYTAVNIAIDGGPLNGQVDYGTIYENTVTNGNDKSFLFSGIAVPKNTAIALSPYSYTVGIGPENVRKANLIEFEPFTDEENKYAVLTGNGSLDIPFSIEPKNYQKEISIFPYEVSNLDDQATIFVSNAASNVEIRIPDTLKDSFTCVFIQEGTGEVSFIGLGATVITPPSGLTNKIKGQYHWGILEKKLSTTTHYLGGSLMII